MNILILLFFVSLLFGQLGGISPFPGVVVYIHDIILVVFLILSFKKTRRAELTIPIILFVVACLLSLGINLWRFPLLEIGFGSLYLIRWMLYAALYIFVVRDNPDFWRKGLYVVGVAFGVLGLAQFFLYPDLRNLYYLGWDPHYYRLFSTLLDPNFTGIILVFTLILGFGLWTKKNRIWIIAGEITAFVSLLLTYSRSSFLALGAAIVVLAIMKKKWKLLLALFAFISLIFIFPKTSGSTLNLFRVDSSLARIGNWQQSIALVKNAPVFGYGFDTLRYLQPSTTIISKAASGVDSSMLFILATTGIIGFVVYVYLLISMIRIGKKSYFYVASMAALLVHGLFVNSLFYPWVMIWIWILAGTIEKKTS